MSGVNSTNALSWRNGARIVHAVSREGRRPPVQDRMALRQPRSDARTLGFTGAMLEDDAAEGDWRRVMLKLVD